jgi:hypothetical protein
MTPGQELDLTISYNTRGLDCFSFQIPEAREIRDFRLSITVDGIRLQDVNYPEGCLPPKEKPVETPDGKGVVLAWSFDRAITTAGMGIALPAQEQPGSSAALVLARGFFTVVYPMISLVGELAGSLHGIMTIALIVFVLALLRKKEIITIDAPEGTYATYVEQQLYFYYLSR